jgi:hypothetical protein
MFALIALAHAEDLYVSSNERGAAILLNGVDTGYRTPATVSGVKPGKTLVEVETACARGEALVDIERGVTTRVSIIATEVLGTISVIPTPPSARLELDGAAYPGAPGVPVAVTCGPHTLRATLDGHVPAIVTLDVGRGQDLTVPVTLSKLGMGTLELSVTPRSATIYLDDKPVGSDAVTLPSVYQGPHHISAELDGYQTVRKQVIVGSGDVQAWHFELVRTSQKKQTSTVTRLDGGGGGTTGASASEDREAAARAAREAQEREAREAEEREAREAEAREAREAEEREAADRAAATRIAAEKAAREAEEREAEEREAEEREAADRAAAARSAAEKAAREAEAREAEEREAEEREAREAEEREAREAEEREAREAREAAEREAEAREAARRQAREDAAAERANRTGPPVGKTVAGVSLLAVGAGGGTWSALSYVQAANAYESYTRQVDRAGNDKQLQRLADDYYDEKVVPSRTMFYGSAVGAGLLLTSGVIVLAVDSPTPTFVPAPGGGMLLWSGRF